MATREDDPAIVAQRAAAAKKLQEKAVIAREQKRAAAAREGKSRFARSSVLKIKEVTTRHSRCSRRVELVCRVRLARHCTVGLLNPACSRKWR